MTLFIYDFTEFIDRIKDLPYQQMLITTEQTLIQAENQSRGSKGAIRARQQGSLAFVDAVGEFLFFLRVGSKLPSYPSLMIVWHRIQRGNLRGALISACTLALLRAAA
jgi:hypothetical protein